jgi:hypothetical protein
LQPLQVDGRVFETFHDLWVASDIIVEAVIGDAHDADLTIRATPPRVLVRTDYDLDLVEIFKADSRVSASTRRTQLRMLGGSRDKGSSVEEVSQKGLPLFRKGERYVLFLRNPDGLNYSLTTGQADSVFLVQAERIVPRGLGSVAQDLGRHGHSDLATLLRRGGGSR